MLLYDQRWFVAGTNEICRLDKFYLLIRRFVGAAFKLLAREDWDPTAIAEYNEILTGPGGPL